MGLFDGSALGILEAVQRAAPAFGLEALAEAAHASDVWVYAHLQDSVSANNLMYEVVDHLLPWMLHWKVRCESHQYNMITTRAYLVLDLTGGLFAFSRLMRTKPPRQGLADAMKRLALRELKKPGGIKVLVRPDAGSKRLSAFVHKCQLPSILLHFHLVNLHLCLLRRFHRWLSLS